MASRLPAQGSSGLNGRGDNGRAEVSTVPAPKARDLNKPKSASQQDTQKQNPLKKSQTHIENILDIAYAVHQLNDPSAVQDGIGLIKEAAAAALQLLRAVSKDESPQLDLPTILKEIQDTIKNSFTQSPALPKSWANVAAATPPESLSSLSSTVSFPKLTIQFTEEERQRIQSIPTKELVADLRKQGLKEAIAARRLPSGDVDISITREEDRDAILKTGTWATILGTKGRIIKKPITIEISSVRIADINLEEERALLDGIKQENTTHIPALSLEKAYWMKKRHRANQTHSSLLAEIPSKELAALLYRRGLVINGEIHIVRPYDYQCRATQCFNCLKFKHTSTACRAPARCANCAEEHNTKKCTQQDKAKCANCGLNHKGWSKSCYLYKDQDSKAKAHRVKLNYQAQTQLYSGSPDTSTLSARTVPHTTGKRSTPSERSPSPVRRGPGRPRRTDLADRTQTQILIPQRRGPGRPRTGEIYSEQPRSQSRLSFTQLAEEEL